MVEIRVDGDLVETAPAPSKETINTKETINYINICNSEYLKLFKAGDTNG